MNLSVVTIRKDGEEQDKEAIQRGDEALMSRTKLFLDMGGVVADAEDIRWACTANGALDLQFFGNQDEEIEGHFWELGGQGVKKLAASNGYAVVLRWMGQGPGTGSCEVSVSVGEESANVVFPKAD